MQNGDQTGGDHVRSSLEDRLQKVKLLESDLARQKEQIENTLTSLVQNKRALKPQERKYIMTSRGSVSIVVTGVQNLEATALAIQEQIATADFRPPIFNWSQDLAAPQLKPYIVIVPEADLQNEKVRTLNADTVVVRNISSWTSKIESQYLGLYENAGPHMATVFNADDSLSITLLASMAGVLDMGLSPESLRVKG